ncbi:MAG: transcriptional repressor [Clostridiales bacterium]|nr:transcriptional repressor [Clostridiales bacterium]
MARSKTYSTRQREAILAYLASLGGQHITANQVALYFERAGSPIGLATIYRHLDRFVQSGKVRKHHLDGAPGACYQHIAGEHPHPQIQLKCEACGAVLHLHCSMLEEIPAHVYQAHSFQINPLKTVLYGKCPNCL